ncbi:MAG: 5-formyltetrahydrofolate cyclo-ligase [Clostridiales bacterium]|nr:5-formyltetrahydrofolate cyclo-ligase [Clostridiales bacterium]
MGVQPADGIKREIREQVKRDAAALTEAYLRDASERITALVLEHMEKACGDAGAVFCYVSTAREPDTRRLIRALCGAGKRVCVPRCLDGGRMEAVLITGERDLIPGRFGIPEPLPGLPVIPPEKVCVCVIPCLSAGADGVRLGHGGGYYDRWLAACPGRKICLCFEALRREGLPTGEHDISVDALVTEKGIVLR